MDFMERFDDQWTRVCQMTAGPDPYRQKFRAFLDEDYVTRDFLLAALSKHYPNPVDNLTIKPNLSYAELKHHIRALASNGQLSTPITITDAALVTENKQARRRQGKAHQSQKVQPPSDECSYCKKHGNTYKGHRWQNCRKLKRDQKRGRDHTANNNNNQHNPNQSTGLIAQALVTTEQNPTSNVSSTTDTWKLDTCSSAHMTSDIGLFEHIHPHHGLVGVWGG